MKEKIRISLVPRSPFSPDKYARHCWKKFLQLARQFVCVSLFCRMKRRFVLMARQFHFGLVHCSGRRRYIFINLSSRWKCTSAINQFQMSLHESFALVDVGSWVSTWAALIVRIDRSILQFYSCLCQHAQGPQRLKHVIVQVETCRRPTMSHLLSAFEIDFFLLLHCRYQLQLNTSQVSSFILIHNLKMTCVPIEFVR